MALPGHWLCRWTEDISACGAGLPSTGCPGQLLAVETRGELSAEGEGVNVPEGNAVLEPGLRDRREDNV